MFLNGSSDNVLLALVPPEQVAVAANLPFELDLHAEPKLKVGDATLSSPIFRLETHWMDNFGEMHCEECTMVEYIPGQSGFAGAAYATDQITNFGQAKKAVFFVMGENGGEKVTFRFAGKDAQGPIAGKALDKVFDKQQFAVTTKELSLKKGSWQRLEVSLDNADLANVKYPFAFQLTPPPNDATKVRFFIKGVTFDTEPAINPLPVEKELPTG